MKQCVNGIIIKLMETKLGRYFIIAITDFDRLTDVTNIN